MKKYFFFTIFILLFITCREESTETAVKLDPTPYPVNIANFPDPQFPIDNIPTIAGVKLGRMLFYEKKLSKDGSMSCASCHRQQNGFSDTLQFSIGVEKLPGKRQAMALMNLAWHKNGMFWDGRAPLVRDQALKPIQDALEMNETLVNVVAKLQADKLYTNQFIRAFGSDTISSEKIGRAIEQFEFIMVSGNSKFDQSEKNLVVLTQSEQRGRNLFFTEFDPSGVKKGAECFHCHGGFNFTNDDYMNNGLDAENNQSDLGRQNVTKKTSDKAKFKVPSLRNIANSPPYMHDGRFKSLEEVIDHYNSKVINSPTVEFILQYNLQPGGLKLSSTDKEDLIAFLKTLSDQSFLANSEYKSPF